MEQCKSNLQQSNKFRIIIRYLIILQFTLFINCLFVTVNPIYNKSSVISNNNILGKWRALDGLTYGNCEFNIFKRDSSSYFMDILRNSKKRGRFVLNLTKIKDSLFIDMFPMSMDSAIYGDIFQSQYLPLHTVFQVSLYKDTIKLREPNPDLLKNAAEAGSDNLKCIESSISYIPTVDTEELRKYIHSNMSHDSSMLYLGTLVKN